MVDKLIERYFRLENPSGYPVEILSNSLNMSFSEEFVRISSICRFDYLGRGTEWFSAQQLSDRSVVGETLNLRKNFGLPKEYLFLADDGTSALFMKCFGDHEEIWDIAEEDIGRLCAEEPLLYKTIVYKTFPEFFEFLLNQREEEMRNEE
jgi:hypothetical protein